MKSILFLTLTTLSIAVPAAALEVKVTCNPRVSEVWLQPNSKFETSGTAESQYMIPARKRFLEQKQDRLTIEEIKKLTTRTDEGGEFLNDVAIEREFPLLVFNFDEQNRSLGLDQVLAFSNIASSKEELENGNYLQLRGYTTWFGDETNKAIVIHGVVYKNGKPQIGHTISLSVIKPENVIESTLHPLEIQKEYAIKEFSATTTLKGFDALDELKKVSEPYDIAMGDGTIASLTLDCSIVE